MARNKIMTKTKFQMERYLEKRRDSASNLPLPERVDQSALAGWLCSLAQALTSDELRDILMTIYCDKHLDNDGLEVLSNPYLIELGENLDKPKSKSNLVIKNRIK